MGLLQEWREYAYGVDINSAQGKAIWDKYFAQEKVIYEELLADPSIVVSGTVKELAEKYHKSTVQIILRWHIQMGFGLVPGSKSMDHIKDNANIFDFELTGEEMKQIETINKHEPFYHVTEESLHRMATTKCNFE